PGLRASSRPSRSPELFSTCPVRGEARPCHAPSGRHALDRRPAATSLRPSRRILRISLSAEVEPLPAAYRAAARLPSAPSRYSFLTSSFSPQSPTAASLFRRAVVFVTTTAYVGTGLCPVPAGRSPASTKNLPNHFNAH